MKRKAPLKTKPKATPRTKRLQTLVDKNNALLRRLEQMKQRGRSGEPLFMDDDVTFNAKSLPNHFATPTTGKEAIKDRTGRYGEFNEMAALSQRLKTALRDVDGNSEFGSGLGSLVGLHPVFRESLEVICQKMARIVCGDAHYIDSWADIAGYAELAIKHIQKNREGRL